MAGQNVFSENCLYEDTCPPVYMFNLMFTFFFFVGITYTSDDVICVPDSNIDPEIVKSITWLPLVGVLQGVDKSWTPFFPIFTS